MTLKLAAILILLLGSVGAAQSDQMSEPSSDDDFVCGLTSQPVMTMRVSVWDLKRKSFVLDLDHPDFEILVVGKSRPIDFFLKPAKIALGDERYKYTIGFMLEGGEEGNWKDLKVTVNTREKTGSLTVSATPLEVLN